MSSRKIVMLGAAAALLMASLTVAPSASAHVCTNGSTTSCDGSTCDPRGILHIHSNTNGTCYAVCGEICNGEPQRAEESKFLTKLTSFFTLLVL